MMRRAWIAAAAALLASGCAFPLFGPRTGRPLREHGEIAPGTTTVPELFARFGPPMAIAGSGEQVEVPAATVHHVDDVGMRFVKYGGGTWTQDGDAWLELFADRRTIGEALRVYYWYSSSESGAFLWPVVTIGVVRGDALQELWVLVDEERGVVVDAAFRER